MADSQNWMTDLIFLPTIYIIVSSFDHLGYLNFILSTSLDSFISKAFSHDPGAHNVMGSCIY